MTKKDFELIAAALAVSARKALAAWDSTVLPQSNDGMLQEAMERLRAALAATKAEPPADRAALAALEEIRDHANPYESNTVDQNWIYKKASAALAATKDNHD